MDDMIERHFAEEVQRAVEKHAQLSDIQLCDKIAEMSDQKNFTETLEGKEALMMRLTAMSQKELTKLRKYAEGKLFKGNFGYANVLNVFKIKTFCNM